MGQVGATGLDHLADNPTQHPTLLWLLVVAAYESEWHKHIWRQSDEGRVHYLEHLLLLGYRPCRTEQLMIDGTTEIDGADLLTDDDD